MTKSILAKNLRVLRSINGYNQDALALALGVTRNKIASYETQNIEPKLSLLIKISQLFEVAIDDLIGNKITEENYEEAKRTYKALQEGMSPGSAESSNLVLDEEAIDDFINKNILIAKMVDGMKTFYDFKKKDATLSVESQQLMYILEHLMSANKEFLATVDRSRNDK